MIYGSNLHTSAPPDAAKNSCSLTNFYYLLRTFARKFGNIDLFLKILPLKDDELNVPEMKKTGGSPTSFWREYARKNI